MNVSHPRALIVSLGVALGLAIVTGIVYALLADKILVYGIGTMLFVVGVVALAMGLLGALEPEEGWATQKRTRGRRSMAAKVTQQHPDLDDQSPLALGVWGVVVGGPLIALAFLAFNVAAS